jgi:hypothetical protein
MAVVYEGETILATISVGCRLGGVKVSVLDIGPKVRGFKLGRGDGFLRELNIQSTPSFGGEEKPEAIWCRFKGILQITCKY